MCFPHLCGGCGGARVPSLVDTVDEPLGDRLSTLVSRVTYTGDDRQVVVRPGLVLD